MTLHQLSKVFLTTFLLASSITNSYACTVLAFIDAKGNVYQGRANEFLYQQPDELTYWPAGTRIESVTPNGQQGKTFNTKYAILAATLKGMTPNAKQDTVHEAANDQGMSLTTNFYTLNGQPTVTAPPAQVLSALDFAAWALGNFQTVEQLKQALQNKDVDIWLPQMPNMGNLVAPLHFAIYDKVGGAVVIEWTGGQTLVYDNKVGVMTNEPPFPWHLENMNNYAYLTNVDKNTGKFNKLSVTAFDSGGAMAALPAANNSMGRFVRAAYYANFAKKAKTPEQALLTMGHVMNNFDRPIDITVDKPNAAAADLGASASKPTSEATYFTVIKDLSRNLFLIRTINAFNFTQFDLNKLSAIKETRVVSFKDLNANTNLDGTPLFLK